MAFVGFKIPKFSGGSCPQTPLKGKGPYGRPPSLRAANSNRVCHLLKTLLKPLLITKMTWNNLLKIQLVKEKKNHAYSFNHILILVFKKKQRENYQYVD